MPLGSDRKISSLCLEGGLKSVKQCGDIRHPLLKSAHVTPPLRYHCLQLLLQTSMDGVDLTR
jgi:hypothetical protein